MTPQDLPQIQVRQFCYQCDAEVSYLFSDGRCWRCTGIVFDPSAVVEALRAKPARRPSSILPRLATGADLGAGSAVAAPVTPPLTVTRDKATPILLADQAI